MERIAKRGRSGGPNSVFLDATLLARPDMRKTWEQAAMACPFITPDMMSSKLRRGARSNVVNYF
jgi:hypothetical protein